MVLDNCAELTSTGGLQDCGGGIVPDEAEYNSSWGPSWHLKIGGAVPIPTSRKYFSAKRAMEEGIRAKKAMLPSLENEIRYNVHRAFHAVTGAREMLYTLSEGRKHLVKARQKIEENLEKQEGTETEVDLIKLKVFEAQLDAMEQEAVQIERQGMAAIRFLVQASPEQPVDIPDAPQQLVDSTLAPLEDYLTRALKHRPELAALQHGIEAYRANLEYRRAELVPELAFVIGMRWGRTPGVRFRQNVGTEADPEYVDDIPYLYKNSANYSSTIPTMALVMTYPLTFGEDIYRIKQARAELAAMVMDRKWAIEGVAVEVETAYIALETTRAAIDALSRSKQLAKGWLAAAVQNNATGIGPSKEVKDALKEYFGIMAQIHQKIAEYNMGVANLDRVTGAPQKQEDDE